MPIQSIPIELGGRMRNICFDFNALCQLEDELKISIAEVGKLLSGSVRATTIRTVLYAGLIHEDDSLTMKDVGKLMEPARLAEIAKAIGRAFTAAFAKDGGEPKNAAGRPAKINGIGKSS